MPAGDCDGAADGEDEGAADEVATDDEDEAELTVEAFCGVDESESLLSRSKNVVKKVC